MRWNFAPWEAQKEVIRIYLIIVRSRCEFDPGKRRSFIHEILANISSKPDVNHDFLVHVVDNWFGC